MKSKLLLLFIRLLISIPVCLYSSLQESVCDTIPLYAGWNCFSMTVDPTDHSIESVLASIDGKYDCVRSIRTGTEVEYQPSASSNSLNDLDPLHGYFIHMLTDAELRIEGERIAENTSIPLVQGENLIAYLPQNEQTVAQTLDSIESHLVMVKTIDPQGLDHGQAANGGLTWIPGQDTYNTLKFMQKGFGYLVEVSEACDLVYARSIQKTMIASETIGSAGGTLETDDFQLIIPENALTSASDLKLYVLDGESPAHAYSISQYYQVDGLPDNLSQPITFRVQCQESPDDTNFICLEQEAMDIETGEMEWTYSIYPVTVSEGGLQFEWPVAPESGLNKKSPAQKTQLQTANGELSIRMSFTGKLIRNQTDHFFYYTVSPLLAMFNPYMDELMATLEEAYQVYQDLNLDFKFYQEIRFERNGLNALTCELFFSSSNGLDEIIDEFRLVINMDHLDMIGTLKIKNSIRKTLLEMILYTYYPSWPFFINFPVPDNQRWLNWAVAEWAPVLFPSQSDYYPDDFPFWGNAALSGMQRNCSLPNDKNDLKQLRQHAIGMSSLIKYLTEPDRYTTSIIPEIYTKIKAGNHPVDAIASCVEHPIHLWWPNFLMNLILGNVYPLTGNDLFYYVYFWDAFYYLTSDNKPPAKYKYEYQDLSARLFYVDLINPNIRQDTQLRFIVSTEDPDFDPLDISLSVYTSVGEELDLLEMTSVEDSIDIPNVYQYANMNTDLYVMVTNSSTDCQTYTSKSTIQLEIKPVYYEHMRAEIEVGVKATLYHKGEFWYDDVEFAREFNAFGTFDGTTFTGTAVDTIMNSMARVDKIRLDKMIMQFNYINMTIESFEARFFAEDEDIAIEGAHFPLDAGRTGYSLVNGKSVCDYINYLYGMWGFYEMNNQYRCTDESWLYIKMWPYDPENPTDL